MDVCLPGTGGMVPLVNRHLSCCWIEHMGASILIDCGEGTQVALAKAGLRAHRLDAILFTHFHADHCAGLPGLLLTMGNNGKTTPLVLCGPKGLGFVAGALCVIAPFLPFPVHVIEFDDHDTTHEAGNLCIATLPLDHGMPCLGYRVTLKRKPVFNPQKAEALCVPLPLYKVLHEGTEITLDDGRRITPKMVTDGPRTPISVCYITDTRPFDGIAAFCRGADLLVCEGTHANETLRGKTYERGHMLFSESAAIAAEAGVKRLWLTHFSPALTDPGQEIDKAKSVFQNAVAGCDGLRLTL